MQLRKGLDVPPGYDPTSVAKPKTKAAKKNEKRKEKKQQTVNAPSSQESPASDGVSNISDHLSTLKVSTTGEGQQLNPSEQADSANVTLDKRIRALKKKIRLMELKETSSPGTSLSSEQTEKLEAWRLELQGLEASLASE
uniref:WIBG Mago-binding domain-containing protein n=1 Tax=Physcomitrium patens TaxID=3218 RepID=A0A7I4FPE5_PHYPA